MVHTSREVIMTGSTYEITLPLFSWLKEGIRAVEDVSSSLVNEGEGGDDKPHSSSQFFQIRREGIKQELQLSQRRPQKDQSHGPLGFLLEATSVE